MLNASTPLATPVDGTLPHAMYAVLLVTLQYVGTYTVPAARVGSVNEGANHLDAGGGGLVV